jgi:hypothetical protein
MTSQPTHPTSNDHIRLTELTPNSPQTHSQMNSTAKAKKRSNRNTRRYQANQNQAYQPHLAPLEIGDPRRVSDESLKLAHTIADNASPVMTVSSFATLPSPTPGYTPNASTMALAPTHEHQLSRRNFTIGILLLLLVVFLWTASNFVTQVSTKRSNSARECEESNNANAGLNGWYTIRHSLNYGDASCMDHSSCLVC